MYIDIRQRLQLASGDSKFSPDQEDAIGFVTTTSRKAAIMVRGGEGREGEERRGGGEEREGGGEGEGRGGEERGRGRGGKGQLLW